MERLTEPIKTIIMHACSNTMRLVARAIVLRSLNFVQDWPALRRAVSGEFKRQISSQFKLRIKKQQMSDLKDTDSQVLDRLIANLGSVLPGSNSKRFAILLNAYLKVRKSTILRLLTGQKLLGMCKGFETTVQEYLLSTELEDSSSRTGITLTTVDELRAICPLGDRARYFNNRDTDPKCILQELRDRNLIQSAYILSVEGRSRIENGEKLAKAAVSHMLLSQKDLRADLIATFHDLGERLRVLRRNYIPNIESRTQGGEQKVRAPSLNKVLQDAVRSACAEQDRSLIVPILSRLYIAVDAQQSALNSL